MHQQEFKKLYDHCQTLTPKVSRRQIQLKLREMFPDRIVVIVKTELNTDVTRGFFIYATNTDHPFVKNTGRDVVVLASSLNECWQRFVTTKEFMHLFDEPGEMANSSKNFEDLLLDFESQQFNNSRQMESEISTFWMALACLCPESSRLHFKSLRDKQQIDDYGIALQLKIPQKYVPRLFSSRYPGIIKNLLP